MSSLIDFHKILRLILVLSFFIIGFISFYFLSSLIFPFIIAWFIAFFINPMVNFLQHTGKLPRTLSVAVVLLFFFSLLIGLIILLIAELVAVTEYLTKMAPSQSEEIITAIHEWVTSTIIPFVNQLVNSFTNLESGQQNTIITNLNQFAANLTGTIGGLIQYILKRIPAILSWFPNAFTAFFITIIASFFISKDWYRLKAIGGKLLSTKAKQSSMKIYHNIRHAIFGFIRAQLILMLITLIIVLVGLNILNVDYPFVLSLVIGFVDLVPYLGTGIIFIPWIIYQFIIQNQALAIGLLVLYLLLIVIRQLIEPKLVSTNIGVNPLATLIAVFIGWKLFGMLGVILAPGLLVFFHALYKAGIIHDLWNFIQGKN